MSTFDQQMRVIGYDEHGRVVLNTTREFAKELGLDSAQGWPEGMHAILVRVAIDQAYGLWNAPTDEQTNEFVYVPIPEGNSTVFAPGMSRRFSEVLPVLHRFSESRGTRL